VPKLQDITIPLTIQIDTDAAATEVDRVARAMAAPAVLMLLANRAQWGWACIVDDVPPYVLASRDDLHGLPGVPVLVIRSHIGPSLVLDLNVDELVALGPCPNL
jgi:hypothetical protein